MNTGRQTPLRAGINALVTASNLGNIVSFRGAPGAWHHPWWTTPHFDTVGKQWFATVKPGYVNGICPRVHKTVAEAATDAQNGWGLNPLSGEPFFSASVFQHSQTSGHTTEVWVPLYATPSVPLAFRNVGFDGGSDVPQFFLDRGVSKPKAATDPLDENFNAAAAPEAPAGNRLLRAADIVVHQPRTALTSQIEVDPAGFLTGMGQVKQTLSLRSAAAADRLKIFSTAKWSAPSQFTGSTDLLAGDFEEAAYDEHLVSTIYLLSPPDTQPGSAPDNTWQAFVRHSLFWNLSYAQPVFRVFNTDPGTPFIITLAFGLAQFAVGYVASSINDMTNQALNILTAHSMAGHFWVPTGGGSDSQFPAVAAEKAKGRTGLDTEGALAAQRAAAAASKRATQLDPDFPFNSPQFPTSLLAS